MEKQTISIAICIPQPSDGQDVRQIAGGINLFTPEDVRIIDELWSEFASKGNDESWYHFLVAREGSRIVGFSCYGRRPLTEGTFDLYWIGVDQTQQGKGIGKALLCATEEQVRDAGGRLLIAETAGKPEFEPTRRFYLAAGYELEARIRDFYCPGDDLVVFTKRFQ